MTHQFEPIEATPVSATPINYAGRVSRPDRLGAGRFQTLVALSIGVILLILSAAVFVVLYSLSEGRYVSEGISYGMGTIAVVSMLLAVVFLIVGLNWLGRVR